MIGIIDGSDPASAVRYFCDGFVDSGVGGVKAEKHCHISSEINRCVVVCLRMCGVQVYIMSALTPPLCPLAGLTLGRRRSIRLVGANDC